MGAAMYGPAMCRWVVVLVLSVVLATAGGRSASAQPSRLQLTTQAWNSTQAAERKVAGLTAQRNALAQRFEDELREVDRLKNAKRSWRRDRELRDQLATTNELGKQLEAVNAELARAQQVLAGARKTLVSAIDSELASGPAAPRRAQLEKARAQVAPQARKAHRIVLPDMQIDPLADPEELDQQAIALRETEAELRAQIKGLDAQAKELERVAMLRKQHDRMKELDQREDQSRRTGGGNGGRALGGAEASSEDSGGPPDARPNETGATPPPALEDAAITLAEVIDPATIDQLKSAQRSGDPKRRAEIAKQLRDAVSKKLEQMAKQRKQVEDRAAQLRGKR